MFGSGLGILFLIGSFIKSKFTTPVLVSATVESADGLIIAKHYTPEQVVDRMALPGEYAVFYEDFNYVAPQYKVDIMIDEDRISLDSKDLYESVRMGDMVHLELEHQKLVQKGLLSDENSYRTQVRDFSLNSYSNICKFNDSF